MLQEDLRQRTGLICQARMVFSIAALFAALVALAESGLLTLSLVTGPIEQLPDALSGTGASGYTDIRYGLLQMQSILILLTAFIWHCWLFLSFRFLRKAGQETRLSPWACVAVHHVPVVKLIMPIVLLDELEGKMLALSATPSARYRSLGATTAFLTSFAGLTLTIVGSVMMEAETLDDFAVYCGMFAGAQWLVVLALFLAHRFARKIETMQYHVAGLS